MVLNKFQLHQRAVNASKNVKNCITVIQVIIFISHFSAL